jgi:hypothetical protein
LCNIIAGTYTLSTVYSSGKPISEKTAEETKKEARYFHFVFGLTFRDTYAIKFQLTQDVFDALIPAGSLGYLPFMDEGLIGLAGVVSSLMGGYTQWRKTK